jgi:hypothetical protein
MKKGLFFLLLTLLSISCMEDAQICVNENKINTNLICDSVYRPVCGCDNNTYYNECEAENKAGINIYTEGLCQHTCTYNDTLMVMISNDTCVWLTDFTGFYEVDYAPENTVWEIDKYYLLNAMESHSEPNCGADKKLNILCAMLYDQSCTALIQTSGIDNQLPNDSLGIDEINLINNCLTVDYNYLGGCDDTRLNLHHLVDSSTAELVRLQLRYDNGDGPCTETISEHISFNLSTLQIENQNSITISIDCNGDDSINEMIQYEY